MGSQSPHRTAVVFILITLLAAGWDARAQKPRAREEISEELAALVLDRREAIELDAANLTDDEWAGSYRSSDGPTISTHLAWTPAQGFTVWWVNCSRPQTARVNYGSAVFTGGSLKLTPELPEASPSSYPTAPEYLPVKWGEQHFLIPSDRMMNFAYAVNSTSSTEVESFLVKVEDYQKERKGVPGVPREYQKYLDMKPLRAALAGFGPHVDRWYPRVILDAGRAEGVVPEMKFYLSRPGDIYMQLVVTDVREHTSEAFVLRATFTDEREEEVEPQVGWEFTSRAPEDDPQYQPG